MNSFRAFKHRNFKLFFYGQSVSLLGTWIQKTAVVWLVYRLTGSALLLGVVTFVSLIPTLILSPYAGSYIDRHDGFKVMKNTQIASLLQAGALAFIVYFGFYNVAAIIFLSLVQGIINAFDVICRQSLMVKMVGDKADLPNAIAMNSTMSNMARVVGPAFAGVMLTTLGEDFCFVSNFLSYLPVLFCLYKMKIDPSENNLPVNNILDDLKAGFKYITSDKEMIGLIMLLSASSLLVAPFTTLMPVFAKDLFHGNAGTFSLFESAIGVGSVISAIYMAQLTAINKLIKVTIVSSVIFGVGIIIIGVAGNISFALLGMVVGGCGMMAQSSSINTYIQTHAKPEMRSRAIGYYVMAYLGISPIGSLMIGGMAEWMKPREIVAMEGIIGLLVVAAYLFYRKRLKESRATRRQFYKVIKLAN